MLHDDDLLNTGRKLVFYGAGNYAREFTQRHCIDKRHLRLPDYVCDRDAKKWGTEFFGVPIRSPDLLLQEPEDGVVVVVTTSPFAVLGDACSRLYYYDFYAAEALEIRFMLSERGATEVDRVRTALADDKSRHVFDTLLRGQAQGQIWFRDIYEPHPYFGNDVVPSLPDGEALVDAGAYLGAHIAAFANVNPNFRAVYAFEPYRPHFETLTRRFAQDLRVRTFAQGLFDRSSRVAFWDGNPTGAHVVPTAEDSATAAIEVVRLDDAVADDVTYIKMDIEGAELNALAGAAAVIRRNRPKLAICVYHRADDYLDIPRIIHDLRPDYRLFLRHHSCFRFDTVLYAV
jgi:FkbM family methyltransferase